MMKKTVLVFLALTAPALRASGGDVTKRFDWAPAKGVQVLDWTENGITVKQVSFDLGSVLRPLRVSTANAVARVDNDSNVNAVVGLAIAVFDGENRLVAAGDGGVKMGHLSKGERDDFKISFSHVYRNLSTAKYFYVTIETKDY
jgi:hypothetical protein